ncbi:MAG: site-2 protease family protein [Anaerolineae bacterium]|jgi:Zn-dependent protease|nr:site-2 protease family protein [Anaerolineae bacterium]MDH7472628.1 site-2 protease family protein [Anaerolineae bacterium]
MVKSSIKIGTLFGIPLRVHISWFLIFILITWSLAGVYFPQRYPHWSSGQWWAVGLVTSLLFFGSVLVHELAHSLVARSRGLPIQDITLFIFGGASQITEEPRSAGTEFLMAIAGPLISLVLGALFGALALVIRHVNEPVAALSIYLSGINLMLAVFNLLPGFPLDGGRVLRAALWAIRRDFQWATRWASLAGQGLAYLFIILGIWQVFRGNWTNGLWTAFIGWFLDNAAQTSYRQVALQSLLAGHTVREIMTRECYPLAPDLTLERLVHEHILATGRRCYPVISEGQVQGLLTIHSVKQVPRQQWATTTVQQAMIPFSELKTIGPDEGLWSALQQMTTEGVNQLPVMEKGNLLGMLARDNVLTFLRTKAELGIP